MRDIKYLSPSAIKTFYSDREEYYLKYCTEHRPPRMPQTLPMSIGSAFDAFVKNYLVYNLHGSVSPEFEIETIFEAQVEEQNRDWAFKHGEHVFNQYKNSGALSDLMIELEQASEEPQFEFTVEGRIAHESHVDGIPLLGKPDVYFKTKEKMPVIIDWKVNGYCGKRPTSPKKGFLMCRDGWTATDSHPKSRNHRTIHKNCQPMAVSGIPINLSFCLEEVDKDWANQTAMYLWLLGEPIGTNAIVGIDQLCGMPIEGEFNNVRIASHRCRVSAAYQDILMEQINGVWSAIQNNHIFTDLSKEENDEKSALLDIRYKAYARHEGCNEANEDWFQSLTRQY